ncbi:MAG: GNAT family N-acetyltransferase [Gammaproteobacteria bacterium]
MPELRCLGSEGNRKAFKAVTDAGIPGLLAYSGDAPVGWCAVARREEYRALNRSRVLKPIDDLPVWSITCFFVSPAHQGQGIMNALIDAAKEHVRARGGRLVEAYPSQADADGRVGALQSYMGVREAFEAAGFDVVATPSKAKLYMRCTLDD